MGEDNFVSNLLDDDLAGYELRSMFNLKNPFYDKYETREYRQARKRARENKTVESMEQRAKKLTNGDLLAEANEVRAYMLSKGIKGQDVAYVMGVHKCSLSRWFHYAPDFNKHKKDILKAIELIEKERSNMSL